jgi:hypothetical protein
MAIKKRSTGTITQATGSSTVLGLGAAYAKILRVEFKAITGTDTNPTLAITDADGRIVFKATAMDPTTDDSTAKTTEQTTSTKGITVIPSYPAALALENDATAGTVGATGVIARSPITLTQAAGTDGETSRIHVFVEV